MAGRGLEPVGANKYRIVRRIYAVARQASTPEERDSGIELGGRVEGLLIETDLNREIVLAGGFPAKPGKDRS